MNLPKHVQPALKWNDHKYGERIILEGGHITMGTMSTGGRVGAAFTKASRRGPGKWERENDQAQREEIVALEGWQHDHVMENDKLLRANKDAPARCRTSRFMVKT